MKVGVLICGNYHIYSRCIHEFITKKKKSKYVTRGNRVKERNEF